MYKNIIMVDSRNSKLALFPSLLVSLTLCLVLTFIQKGSGLHCLQCMSLLETDCLTGDVKATLCAGEPDSKARYCHKAVGHEVGGHGYFVHRTCSRYAENNCTHDKQKTGKVYKVCHNTCSTDGCNGGNGVASYTTVPLFLLCITGLFSALFKY